MHGRHDGRRRAMALGAILLTLTATTPAFAWNQRTHKELGHQSILYMLRHADPKVRFAGVAILSAGEGLRATPDGERRWPLSAEAERTDLYRDVAMRIESSIEDQFVQLDGVDGAVVEEREWNGEDIVLAYSFAGANFTAYNHFLLHGQDTWGESVDRYERDADGTYFIEEGKPAMHVFMDEHDDEPGFTLASDSSLQSGFKGQFIQLVGTTELQQVCEDLVANKLGYDNDLTWWNPLSWFGELRESVQDAIADRVGSFVGAMCPYAKGSWDFSPALQRDPEWEATADPAAMHSLGVNSSTIDRWDVQERSMYDIRFHPADNLASRGVENFVAWSHLVRDDVPGGGLCDPSKVDHDDPDADLCGDVLDEYEPAFEPFWGGNLRHLGRTLHALGDISVPGHVSGRLLAAEHLVVEGRAAADADDLATYAENATRTGGVSPDYDVRTNDGTEVNLSYFADVEMLEDEIEADLNRAMTEGYTMQRLAEDAARDLKELRRHMERDGEFDVSRHQEAIRPHVRAQLLAHAMANNVVAATFAIHRFYDEHSRASVDERVSDITWTESDRDVVLSQPPKDASDCDNGDDDCRAAEIAGRPVRPYLPAYKVPSGEHLHPLNVDAQYQEYQEYDGCYVESHDWCDAESTGFAGWDHPCQGGEAHTEGPPFVQAEHVGTRVVLSEDNRGVSSEQIHITGAHSKGDLDRSYYRADLTESAGEAVELPDVSLSDGLAVWCNGPTAWQTGPNAPTCAVASIDPIGARECNSLERQRWQTQNTPGVSVNPDGNDSSNSGGGISTGDPVVDVGGLADDLNTSKAGLNEALDSAAGTDEQVTVVSPSPYGRATMVWPDEDSGLTNEATVSGTGRIMVRRTPTR